MESMMLEKKENGEEPLVDPDYGNEYLATDEDFTWVENSFYDYTGYTSYTATNEKGYGYYQYTGEAEIVKIPHEINGHPMTSYYKMFEETNVKKIISDNSNVTYMGSMFMDTQSTSLDLSNFDTSNVTDMHNMFWDSQATSLDLSSFDTSKVTSIKNMFSNSHATTVTGLNKFDTSNVTSMDYMFKASQAPSLDLSSFDTSNVTYMYGMFQDSQVTTVYARTQADADRFNNEETNRPAIKNSKYIFDFQLIKDSLPNLNILKEVVLVNPEDITDVYQKLHSVNEKDLLKITDKEVCNLEKSIEDIGELLNNGVINADLALVTLKTFYDDIKDAKKRSHSKLKESCSIEKTYSTTNSNKKHLNQIPKLEDLER